MLASLQLIITTPAAVLVEVVDIRALRAMDESGSFGILPGHTDLITVLPDSVIRWHQTDDRVHFCAVRSGVLTMTGGNMVRIACREGLVGDNLERLDARVREHRAAQTDANRHETVKQMRLHTQAIRQMMNYLHPTSGSAVGDRPLASKLP